LQFVLILIVANAMFLGSWIVLFSFHGGIIAAAIFGLLCCVTNPVSIMFVGSFGWIFDLVKASRGFAWRA